MKRNVLKASEKGQKIVKQNKAYDIDAFEIQQLLGMLNGKETNHVYVYNALTTAYYMGIEAGSRLQK